MKIKRIIFNYRDSLITHEELSLHLYHMLKQLNQHEINSKILLQLIDYCQYDDYIHVKSKFKKNKIFSHAKSVKSTCKFSASPDNFQTLR
jgi:hypothetical protein